MSFRLRWLALGLVPLGGTTAFAQQPAIPATPLISPAAKPQENAPQPTTEAGKALAAIRAEYDAAIAKQRAAIEAATTDDEKMKASRENAPDRAGVARKALEIAKKYEKTPDAFDALQLALSLSPKPADSDPIIDTLIRDHLDDERIGSLAARYSYGASGSAERLLRAMSTESKVKSVRGKALLAIASSARWNGKDDPAQVKLARDTFQQVLDEYGDVDNGTEKLGEIARREIFAMENLAVGKPCPEITGQDVDGVEFKLSDYAGKVVMLDFWGFW